MPLIKASLLLHGLLGGLGLLTLQRLGGGGLDDTDSHGLPHVTDGEPSEGRVVSEGLNTHGLAGGQQDDGGVTRLDELGVVLGGLTGTTVNLLLDLGKLVRSSLEFINMLGWRHLPCKQCERCGNQGRGCSRWRPVRGG